LAPLVVAIAAHRHALQVRGHGRPEDGAPWAVLKHVDLDPGTPPSTGVPEPERG